MIRNPEKEKNRKAIRVPKGDHQVKPTLRVVGINNIAGGVDDTLRKQTRVL